MQGHQLHRVLIGVGTAFARLQRRMRQERLQRHQILIFFLIAELARCRHQFLKVFDARLPLFAFLLLIHDEQPGIADHPVGLHVERHVGGFMRQRLHQFDKALQRRRGAAGQHFVLHQLARRLPQRQLTIARRPAHHVEGTIADATRRGVDHALEGRIVVAVGNEAQVSQRILDFRRSKKRWPP